MPSGISQSAVNPAALVPRPAVPERTGESTTAQSAQATLATEGDAVVRAPEPGADAQRADNEPANAGQSGQPVTAQPERQLEAEVQRGLGGNVDITA